MQGGVHVKSRGNTSLPTDMVKILKSQDGGYIRAVRQAGLKVFFLKQNCVSFKFMSTIVI